VNKDDVLTAPAWQIATWVANKEISAARVIEFFIAHCQQHEPQIKAFCFPAFEQARQQAQALDNKIAQGYTPGPLAGVPVAIKDLICTRDLPTSSGALAYQHFYPEEDDIAVERLKAADAIILGKTNASEFGYSADGRNALFPMTHNPWNLAMTPGGSSAGSAAAVAAGMCPIALGSDGGGSIRIPAAFCGILGMKASMGRVPLYPGCRDERYPGVSGWETLEHIGPLTRSARDLALVLSVICGPDARDWRSIPCSDIAWHDIDATQQPLKVIVSADFGYAQVDQQVMSCFRQALAVLADQLGWQIEFGQPDFGDQSQTFGPLIAAETDLVGLREMDRTYPLTSSNLKQLLSTDWQAEDFTNAAMARKKVVNSLRRFMTGFDLMITPCTGVAAFPVDVKGPADINGIPVGENDWQSFTWPFNLSGQPAASVPIGFTQQGMPIGMQIIAPHLGDSLLLQALLQIEQSTGWFGQIAPLV